MIPVFEVIAVRALALDVGEKRIGIAVSDPLGVIATSKMALVRTNKAKDLVTLVALIERSAVGLVLVGMPFSLSGGEGPQALRVRQFAEALETEITVPIRFWDERYTTVEAERLLRERGVRAKKLRAQVDSFAAALLLQEYLDAQRRLEVTV